MEAIEARADEAGEPILKDLGFEQFPAHVNLRGRRWRGGTGDSGRWIFFRNQGVFWPLQLVQGCGQTLLSEGIVGI